MSNTPCVVEAINLTKSFREAAAVDGVSFSVHRQECFGLLGPNGAGKTTTARMLYCFIRPDSGQLKVLGMDAQKNPRGIKARVGVCPQENNLDPDLRVWDNLYVFARYFDITGVPARRRCDELLDFVGLSSKRRSPIEELSGGMKRRLMIARSLINQPDLLILDEPTTGLDPQARHQIWESIARLKNSGTTVLLTTHYMDEAAHLCDRLLIMDRGRVVVEGRPEDLVRRHIGVKVIEISSQNAGIESFLKVKGLSYEKTGTHFFVYVSASSRRDLAEGGQEFEQLSVKFGAELLSLRMANLEDVFLKLTGRELRE